MKINCLQELEMKINCLK